MKSPFNASRWDGSDSRSSAQDFEGHEFITPSAQFFRFIFEILSFFKMGVAHNKAVALRVRHDSTVFWVWKIDLGENVSPASKDGTQSCFYDCVIVTLPFCRKQNK